MDSTTRALLVEVARTVLRVLGEGQAVAPAPSPTPAPAPAPVPDVVPGRGEVVRVWTGSMYATGEVVSVCRGTPKRIKVRIARAGKRGKVVVVEAAKAERIKGGA